MALDAIKIEPDNAEALGIYAHVSAFLEKDFDSAFDSFDRAIALNPNLALLWVMSAPTCCYIGKPQLALERLARYRELTPLDPNFRFWESVYLVAHVFNGDYEEVARIGRRIVKLNPDFTNCYKPLLAALGHLGRRDEAKPYVRTLLAREPGFSVARFGKVYPFQREEDRRRYLRGLELAGVPSA